MRTRTVLYAERQRALVERVREAHSLFGEENDCYYGSSPLARTKRVQHHSLDILAAKYKQLHVSASQLSNMHQYDSLLR